jgi:hypothetical protein
MGIVEYGFPIPVVQVRPEQDKTKRCSKRKETGKGMS